MEIGVYILAGGKSKRMGEDKAQVQLGNKSMLESIVLIAKEINPRPIIVSNNRLHDKFASCISDVEPDQGPAMGVLTALEHASAEYNLLLTCDMPLLSGSILNEFDTSNNFEIQCFGNEMLYPFPGMYAKSILPRWKKRLKDGERKMQSLIKSFDYKKLPITNQDLFLNINTKEDLIQAQEKLL